MAQAPDQERSSHQKVQSRPDSRPVAQSRSPAARPQRQREVRGLLIRNRGDRIVAGVAAGLGDLLGVDRVVVRLAFVVLSFAGGVGVVAYLLLWLLSSEPPRSSTFEEQSTLAP